MLSRSLCSDDNDIREVTGELGCRHHHRCKQAEGWWLEQPEPGVLKWRVPSGRSFATTPTAYPL